MNIFNKKALIIILISIIISGCATQYKKMGWRGGYSQTQLDKNMFNVSFLGNRYTSKERISDFITLRSAEITLESGYKYFVIIKENNNISKTLHSTPVTIDSYGNINGGEVYTTSKPSSQNSIILFHKKPKEILSYNAEFITTSIKNKYAIK